MISAKDSQVRRKDEEEENKVSIQPNFLSQDELQNEQKSPDQKRSFTKFDQVKDPSSSDDEIEMNDLGEELSANNVRVTLKKNLDTQCDIGLTDRLSKINF